MADTLDLLRSVATIHFPFKFNPNMESSTYNRRALDFFLSYASCEKRYVNSLLGYRQREYATEKGFASFRDIVADDTLLSEYRKSGKDTEYRYLIVRCLWKEGYLPPEMITRSYRKNEEHGPFLEDDPMFN